MDKLSLRSRAAICFFAIVTLLVALIGPARSLIAQTSSGPLDDASLLEGFRHTEVASVSDAIEQLMSKRMYMSHRMNPIFTSKFVGFAVTVKLKKDEGNTDPNALSGMLAAIDKGSANSV